MHNVKQNRITFDGKCFSKTTEKKTNTHTHTIILRVKKGIQNLKSEQENEMNGINKYILYTPKFRLKQQMRSQMDLTQRKQAI